MRNSTMEKELDEADARGFRAVAMVRSPKSDTSLVGVGHNLVVIMEKAFEE